MAFSNGGLEELCRKQYSGNALRENGGEPVIQGRGSSLIITQPILLFDTTPTTRKVC